MDRQQGRLCRHLDGASPQIEKVSIPFTSNLRGLLHHLLVPCEPLVLQVLVSENLDNARLIADVDAVIISVAPLVHVPKCPSGMEGSGVDIGMAGVVAAGGGKPPGGLHI